MKQFLIIIVLFFVSNMLPAQNLIGTPSSLILVYNYPKTYFYLQLKGVDKKKTGKENVFILDNQVVQVKTLNRVKFSKDENLSFVDFITAYVDWEKNYQEEQFSMSIHSKLVFLRSNKGRDIGFWTYDMPMVSPGEKTDSTRITPVQKQLFVLARIKDYLVGINCPLLATDHLETIKSYLVTNIDGLVESNNEIDVEKLNKLMNK